VKTPAESSDKIPLDRQRHLINNFKMATELGAEVIQIDSKNITRSIIETAQQKKISTVCMGMPHISLLRIIAASNIVNALLKKLDSSDIDLIILS
jgi:two-component system sensor histidine kinase KdpD